MSRRYRLYPSSEQEAVLRRHCGEAGFVWNLALEQFNQWRPGRSSPPGSQERFRQLAEARRETWLGEGSSAVQQQALRDFDQALRNWRGGTHRRPRPRKRGQDDGFCVRDLKVRTLSGKVAELLVPKCGYVRFRLSRPLPTDPGMARVTLDRAGRWQVSITSPPEPFEREPTGALVGIDRGVVNSIATSDGQFWHAPCLWAKEVERVRRLHKHLSRQSRGSNRRQRTKRSLGRLRAKESDRRRDWVEKTTTGLVRDHDLIAVERLQIGNMVRSARGTVEEPGHNVRAKAALNRAILGQCWGIFVRRLKDKAAMAGVRVIEVDPRYTSRSCRVCGHEAAGNRESQAVFRCLACGHIQHADTHAALDILERGMAGLANLAPAVGPAVAGRGAGASGQAMKRQPGEAAWMSPHRESPGFSRGEKVNVQGGRSAEPLRARWPGAVGRSRRAGREWLRSPSIGLVDVGRLPTSRCTSATTGIHGYLRVGPLRSHARRCRLAAQWPARRVGWLPQFGMQLLDVWPGTSMRLELTTAGSVGSTVGWSHLIQHLVEVAHGRL